MDTRGQVWKILISLIPLVGAGLIAITRLMDNRCPHLSNPLIIVITHSMYFLAVCSECHLDGWHTDNISLLSQAQNVVDPTPLQYFPRVHLREMQMTSHTLRQDTHLNPRIWSWVCHADEDDGIGLLRERMVGLPNVLGWKYRVFRCHKICSYLGWSRNRSPC
jgi:hypothetical protein